MKIPQIRTRVKSGMTAKFFALILTFGTFLIVSLTTVITGISSKYLYASARTLLDNQTQQVINVFDQHMEVLSNVVMTASEQQSIKALVNQTYSGYQAYTVYRDAYLYVNNIHNFYKWINLYLFVADADYVMSSVASEVSSSVDLETSPNTAWFPEAAQSFSNISVRSDFKMPVSGGDEQFAYLFTMRETDSWKINGAIAATLDKAVLDDLLQNTQLEENGFMMVLDAQNRPVYISDASLFGQAANMLMNTEYFTDRPDYFADDSLSEYYLVSEKSQLGNFRFVSVYNKQFLHTQIFRLQMLVLGIVLTLLALLLAIARLISSRMTRPIRQLTEFIHRIETTSLSERVSIKANDEVGELVESFNNMLDSVRENQILRRRAQMDALQKQIDPHFLYNTLESIKALAIRGDTKTVCSTIDSLGDMFRYNTNREDKSTTCVQDELQHIQDYLNIQKVRFGNRLCYQVNAEEDLLRCQTLKFILQPVVENSIRYGMESMEHSYLLRIRVSETETGDVRFEIEDNGPGIEPKQLKQMQKFFLDETGQQNRGNLGVGLRNIADRLRLYAPPPYGMWIDSVPGQYTKVIITIPKRQEESQHVYRNSGR